MRTYSPGLIFKSLYITEEFSAGTFVDCLLGPVFFSLQSLGR